MKKYSRISCVPVCAVNLSWISGSLTSGLLGRVDHVPHLVVRAVSLPVVMVFHGNNPVFLGTCGGNNDMKLAKMVTLQGG
jgi:hypothetical protein